MDDTIVQGGGYVSPRVLAALVAAREAGFVLSVASGRALCMVDPKVLGTGAFDYCVCSNGATVVRLADGVRIASHCMSREDALSCHELLAPYRPAWNAFFDGHAFFEWKGASYMLTGRTGAVARARRSAGTRRGPLGRLAWFVRRGARFAWRVVSNSRQRQVLSVEGHLRRATGGVEKIGCTILDAARCAEAAALVEADGRFEVVRMGGTELEITAAGVTKATGAAALMAELGIDVAHAVAFGDGGNDLPLAEAVGRFVAVANADSEVLEAASEVCPSVADDGVAVWIERMLEGTSS